MINLLKKIKLYGIRKFFSFTISELYHIFYVRLVKNSFSQNGEDLIIDQFLNYKKNGFYMDIGAYDPYRFSNTYRFYKKGWQGINIEPNTKKIKKFVSARPRDINLNIGIGTKSETLNFYNFFPDTISTFSQKDAQNYQDLGFKLISRLRVRVERLEKIFMKYCPNVNVDFLSIDTEGFEMKVLKSNNWKKFRPKIICIESFTFNSSRLKSSERREIGKFLSRVGYKKVFSNDTNIIYTLLSPAASNHQNAYSRK